MKKNVLLEKYKLCSFVDERGYHYWLNKYGEVIKLTDKEHNDVPIIVRGTQYMEAGYVYAPYIPMLETSIMDVLIKSTSRYSMKTINKNDYVQFNVDNVN